LSNSVLGSWVDHSVPWKPHSAVGLKLCGRPRQVVGQFLRVPKPLPMEALGGSWHVFDEEAWQDACREAVAFSDVFFTPNAGDSELHRVRAKLGKQMSVTALCIEIYVLIKAGTAKAEWRRYLGRSQQQVWQTRPLVGRRFESSRFVDKTLEFWASLENIIIKLRASNGLAEAQLAGLFFRLASSAAVHWDVGAVVLEAVCRSGGSKATPPRSTCGQPASCRRTLLATPLLMPWRSKGRERPESHRATVAVICRSLLPAGWSRSGCCMCTNDSLRAWPRHLGRHRLP